MALPALERKHYKLGKYDVMAQPPPRIFALTHRPGRPRKNAVPPRISAGGGEEL